MRTRIMIVMLIVVLGLFSVGLLLGLVHHQAQAMPILPVWHPMTPAAVPPEMVTLDGPAEGFVGEPYIFTATVEPVSTTLPVTYTWQASGGMQVIHTGGLTDSASFSWNSPGTQGITVTASNQAGEVVGSHAILLALRSYKTFIPSAMRACLPIYSDDFSDPATGWPVGVYDEVNYAYLDGEYQVLIKPTYVTHGAITDLGVSQFQFELDARAVSNLDGSVGLIFSWIGPNQYYLFEVNDGWYSLWKRDLNDWTLLIDWTNNSVINPGYAWNHLEVERSGSNISLYANGHLLETVVDNSYYGTWVGMASTAYSLTNFDSRYDNFVVYSGCTGPKLASACSINNSFTPHLWISEAVPAPGR